MRKLTPDANTPSLFSTCIICGAAFAPSNRTSGLHCSRACVGISSRKTYPTKTCEKCGCEFEHRRYYDTAGRFCSRKCSNSVSQNPPMRIAAKNCKQCGKLFQYQAAGYERTFCCLRCKYTHNSLHIRGTNHPLSKPKTTMYCEICGAAREVKPALVSRFRACSRRCAAIISQQSWPRKSSLEVAMAEQFRAINLFPKEQFSLGQYLFDFAFPDAMVAVECDGVYWHGRAEQVVKDRRKDAYTKHCGWLMIRLTEFDIRANPTECASRVAGILEKRLGSRIA